MSPVPLAPLARPDRSGLPHLPPIVSTTLRYLQVPPARRALPAHSIRSLVPARRVPSLPLGQGFVSLRSLVPSRRPTGSSLRDIICSRFLIRRPSRWAERRLRRSTGLGDDKNDRRRTPRPLETPHRSGKRHGTGRRVSLLAEVPMPQPLRLPDNRNGSSGRPSAQRVAQGASRIRDRLATTKSRHDLPPPSPRGPRIPRPLRGPVAVLRAQTRRHRHRRDRSPRTPDGVVPVLPRSLSARVLDQGASLRRCDHPRRSRLRRAIFSARPWSHLAH